MAYTKKWIRDESIRIISEDPDIHFLSELCLFLPISRNQFYKRDLHKDDRIKEALYKNKTKLKSELRKKWKDSDNPALNIALYRLLATDRERQKLSQQHIDHTTKGDALPKPLLNLDELDVLRNNGD